MRVYTLTLTRPNGEVLTKPCTTAGQALELARIWLDLGGHAFNISHAD